MNTGFLVDRNPVGPRVSKRGNELVCVLNHQMAVERDPDSLAQGGDYCRTNGQIWHKMAIHHIAMKKAGTAAYRCLGCLGQMGKISR